MFLKLARIPINLLRIGTIWEPKFESPTLLFLYKTVYTTLIRHVFIHGGILLSVLYMATVKDIEVINIYKLNILCDFTLELGVFRECINGGHLLQHWV